MSNFQSIAAFPSSVANVTGRSQIYIKHGKFTIVLGF